MNNTPNPHGSTGPVTESGKQRSSRNATRHGLFATTDFVRETEADEYSETFTTLLAQLTPDASLKNSSPPKS